jgi:hypothetical protein
LTEGRREAVFLFAPIPRYSRHCEEQSDEAIQLRGNMDCFAEPVIKPAFARPVGSQLTVSTRAPLTAVIVRESGRSSIPETSMMNGEAAANWILRFRGV